MMITGDYHHTAIAVAKDVGMIQADHYIIVIDAADQPQPVSEQSAKRISFSASPLSYLSLPAETNAAPSSRSACQHTTALLTQSAGTSPSVLSAAVSAVDAHSDSVLQAESQLPAALSLVHDPHAPSRPADTAGLSHPQQPSTLSQLPHQSSLHGQLRVVIGTTAEDVGLTHALQTMACGHAQCAVTGAAFEHLLQTSDLSVLETVMRNVVVLARMKPHQKGQVMDLLSVRGLHQMHEGRPRHIQASLPSSVSTHVTSQSQRFLGPNTPPPVPPAPAPSHPIHGLASSLLVPQCMLTQNILSCQSS